MAIQNVIPCAPNEITEPNNDVSRLDISKLSVTLTESPKPLLPPEVIRLRFGTTFTDHMAIATYDPSTGWSNPEIKPYAPLMLDPSSSCLQISSSVLEGMKAYLGPDGKARLFRPELNMRRLERSAARLALPPVDGDGTLELIKRLVETEKRWIPTLQGYSLYIRPTIIGTQPGLGLLPSEHAMLCIIASPCGPYFPQGLRPISLLAISETVRAWPGGTGAHKICGNYSPGLVPQRAAAKQGYDQVLWLFGEEKRVTEAGVMHFCVVVTRDDGNGESFDCLHGRYVGGGINLVEGCDFITAPLDGMIIPGVTRASCLALVSDPAFNEAAGLNLHPVERTYTIQDLVEWSSQGKLMEALCIGTAAIVVAVNKIGYEGKDVEVPEHEAGLGPVGMALREKILAIQEGREEYEGWSVVCE
ncbi:branched-chain-amino-acid transaminase [Paxillus involutus ATCC 200175]|uniref:Branched-chain-amino-acid transaminase n=1 Tax=Paxillus involutus ATCC 200175 TaxID=664439 RepID=A0A0C9TX44_PAXIN|nr:branched-chain-amino-acid transaminase [Paxillus involutus ATCC 200175]